MSRPSIATAGALLALGWFAAAGAASLPARVHYEVLDGDKLVGHLDITLETSGEGAEQSLVAKQHGEITVRRMLIKATIRQMIEEHWQNGRLLSLTADTSSELPVGSTRKALSVSRDPSGALRATNDGKTHDLPADTLPLTLWSGRTLVAGPHFGLAEAELIEIEKGGTTADDEPPVRYQGEECRRRDFEAVNDAKKKSAVAAWIGSDDIVCKLRMSAGSDVFT
ncbi:MAG TPA: DUF6134 family protein, partial [Solimonas sp.]|nr:DUF6134 family protein [Solimonas sp.]